MATTPATESVPERDPYWSMTDEQRIEYMSREFMRASQRSMTLFDLSAEFIELLNALDEFEGEPGDELAERLASVEEGLAQKVEGYCSVVRSLQAMRDARKAEADRLRERAAQADRAADFLLARLHKHMQVTGQQRIETGRFTVTLRQNPPKCVVLEEMLVPNQFKHTTIVTTVDKDRIKAHWKETGEVPPGVDVVRTQRVQLS